jgi:Cu2+-exporting ATPase
VGEQTRFAQIVALMESAASSKPQLAQLADRVAKPFLLAVLLAAAAAAAYGWGQDPAHALMVAVAVLVVTCPCALSLATPVAMLAAAGTLARRGVLVRSLQSLETLAGIDVVVFDKTGTLTRDAMTLGAISTRTGVTTPQVLAMAAALARNSLHPVSRALLVAATQRGLKPWDIIQVKESAGQGLSGEVRSPESTDTHSLSLGSARHCGVNEATPSGPHAFLSDESGWLATFELAEDVRSDAASSVTALQAQGIEVQLWSGDAPQAVERVACQVGIVQARGACTPQDKLQQLQTLQQSGKKVAMVGDGLNDGPVLAGADVSFAIGTAVPLAQSRADFVILGEELTKVVRALVLARKTMRIVRQNLAWAAVYNAVCVPVAVAGWMPAWLAGLGMASSSLAVVLNALRLADYAELKRTT